jgi:putative colanic acid biosynthesis UDP-glucose lipid carrier transferase
MTPVAAPTSLLNSRLSPSALLRSLLEPSVIQVALAASVWWNGESLTAPYLVLALIAFFLTYPGHLSFGIPVRALVREVIAEWIGVAAILLFLGYATRYLWDFPPAVVQMWGWMSPLLLFVSYAMIPTLLPRLLALEGGPSRALVVGAGPLGRRLAQQFINTPYLGVKFVGFFEDRARSRLGEINEGPLLGRLDALGEFVKANRIDLVYITLPMGLQPRSLAILDQLRDTTASIYFAPDFFLLDLIQSRMDNINGIPVVAACESPFFGINGLIKRVSDVLLSLLILVLIAPLLVLIALLVKLTSPGPVLFRQRRYGLDGKEIVVYKFRSMLVMEDGAVVRQATRDDSRITPMGRFLRKTSLDELPQFINVLQGRMSIVGPRPHAVAHNEEYRKRIKGYMVRHKVKPGITGWAQVNGFRGETDKIEKMESRIEHDLEYLRNWSLRLDLTIILRTIWVVLRDRQAY